MSLILELIIYRRSKTSEFILAFGKRDNHTGCQVLKVLFRNIYGNRQLRKSPKKKQSVEYISRTRMCHQYSMSTTTDNFFSKKEWLDTDRNVLYKVWLLWFESGPNAAWNWILSAVQCPRPARDQRTLNDSFKGLRQSLSRKMTITLRTDLMAATKVTDFTDSDSCRQLPK
jgi:hypothetical protein